MDPYQRSIFYLYSLLTNKQTSHTHARTNTHTRQQDFLARSPALTQPGDDLPRACGSKWVTQSNGAALGVHLVPVKGQLVAAVHGHGGECLVDLDDVDVRQGEVVLVQELRDGDAGADAHDARGNSGDGGSDVFGYNGLAELDGRGALHEEDCGGCVEWGQHGA